ncbi:alpha/beta hydrolase family protein [Chromobacterium sp. CV08]|uniref:alpha/beta hydrolase family protein n=1 Tax=Chromobacterium sp. CV08 TaxID=3133274 RepID=UPI003DA95655
MTSTQYKYDANHRGKSLPVLSIEHKRLLQSLAKSSECCSPQISADGKILFYIKNEETGSSIISRSLSNGREIQIYKQSSLISSLKVSPKSGKLALDIAPGGSINMLVHIINPEGKMLRKIQTPHSMCQISGWIKNIDNLVVWTSGFKKIPRGLHIITDTMAWRPLFIAQGRSWLADSSQDGSKALVINRPERGLSYLYLLDCATQEAKPLVPLSLESEVRFAQFSRCEKYIYIVSNINSDRYYLGIIPATENYPVLPTIVQAYADADLALFSMLQKGNAAAACWTTPRSAMLETYQLIENTLRAWKKREFAHIRELTAATNGKTIAISSSSATAPISIRTIDLDISMPDQDATEPLFDSTLVEPEYIVLQARDGLEVAGWLYQALPIADMPRRVVISFHGGPEAQETSAFNPLYQILLKTGISIFAPNVRGSTGFGKKFTEMDNGILRKNAIQDIKDCAEWVLGRNLAASGKIGIVGASYGGYMTLMGMAEFPEYFAAGVSISGISNFLTFFKNTTPYMAEISKREYGDPIKNLKWLKSLSPYYKLASINAPLLLIHGENDGNVPYTESLIAFEKLTTLEKDSGLLSIPDEGHCISKKKNQILIYEYIARWFLRFL